MDQSAAFTEQVQRLSCTVKGHENQKLTQLCFEETCTSSRASCTKCLKFHNKHADKLMPIDEVEDFIRGFPGQITSPQVLQFNESKKSIIDELTIIQGLILNKYCMAEESVELKNRISQEQSNETLSDIAVIINKIANVDEQKFTLKEIEIREIASITKYMSEIYQNLDSIKKQLQSSSVVLQDDLSEYFKSQQNQQAFQTQIEEVTEKNLELSLLNLQKQIKQESQSISKKIDQQTEYFENMMKQKEPDRIKKIDDVSKKQKVEQRNQSSELTLAVNNLIQQIQVNDLMQKKKNKELQEQNQQNIQKKNQISELTATIIELKQSIETNEQIRTKQIEELKNHNQQSMEQLYITLTQNMQNQSQQLGEKIIKQMQEQTQQFNLSLNKEISQQTTQINNLIQQKQIESQVMSNQCNESYQQSQRFFQQSKQMNSELSSQFIDLIQINKQLIQQNSRNDHIVANQIQSLKQENENCYLQLISQQQAFNQMLKKFNQYAKFNCQNTMTQLSDISKKLDYNRNKSPNQGSWFKRPQNLEAD